MYNSSIVVTGADGAVYLDNAKIYTPTAPSISIPNDSDISVTGTVEVMIDKYEINPTNVTPANIIVTNNSDQSVAEVDKVIFDPYNLNKFALKFKDGALLGNSTYTISFREGTADNPSATDLAGHPLSGTASFTTKTADLITGLSITPPESSTLSYGAAEGAAFTAVTTPEENVDYNTVVWYVDGVQAATGKTFTFANPTQIKDYTVTASVLGNPSITAGPETVTVTKGTQSAPAAIEVSKTHNSITITPVAGAEYGVKLKSSPDEVVYGANNVFTGLTPETEYTAYIRMAGTDFYNPSEPISTDVTTDEAPVIYGDVSGDGIIGIADVIMAAEIAVGNTGYTPDQIICANVSDKVDMTVDISDVVMIAERVLDPTKTFPVEE